MVLYPEKTPQEEFDEVMAKEKKIPHMNMDELKDLKKTAMKLAKVFHPDKNDDQVCKDKTVSLNLMKGLINERMSKLEKEKEEPSLSDAFFSDPMC